MSTWIELSALNDTTGFRLSGAAPGDRAGISVASAGDVNGDGFADLIVGASGADPNGSSSGASYVVFGKAGGFGSDLNLASLDGTTGFRLSGTAADDDSGASVGSAGDVNGDGFADLIVGSPLADPNGARSGASYVVFGKAGGFEPNVDLVSLNGNDGFRLSGAAAGDRSGRSVASAGDVNGDGFADLIVGSPFADPNGSYSGASYVVFGKAGGFTPNLDLASLDGNNGFRLNGAVGLAGERSGRSVASAGDVNGDGFDDLIIGAPYAYVYDGSVSGVSYVVFGKAGGFASDLELATLDGNDGFRLVGGGGAEGSNSRHERSAYSVASAGDVNGDGFDDVIVGAPYHSGSYGLRPGASYVVFGKAGGFTADISLADLDGSDGFRITGATLSSYSGFSVASAGDVNGDGFADVIVGAYREYNSGASYVVFGKAAGFASTLDLGSLDASDGFALYGAAAYDYSGGSVASAGDVNGDGFADLIIGATGADPNGADSGASYVVFGQGPTGPVSRVGSAASQTIHGGASADLLAGMGGDDILRGYAGSDLLEGDEGNDELHGGAGDDVMAGGAGDDTYFVDDAGDQVQEGVNQGTDTVHTTVSYTLAPHVEILIADSDAGLVLRGNGRVNTITGGAGNDLLNGGIGDDILTGGNGNDVLRGGTGADALNGGDGNDKYFVDDVGDTLTDSSGIDSVFTTIEFTLGDGFERLYANSDSGVFLTGNGANNIIMGRGGSDWVDGGAGHDRLFGGDEADLIFGGDGKDIIDGGLGDDRISGGLRADMLTGGGGNDRFVYDAVGDSGILETNRDTITDFEAGDLIQLIAIDAILGGGPDAFTFIGNAAFTANGQVRWDTTLDGDTVIEANTRGTLGADFSILLEGSHSLTAGDFLFERS